jgi:hypothetical protein
MSELNITHLVKELRSAELYEAADTLQEMNEQLLAANKLLAERDAYIDFLSNKEIK